MKANVIVRSSIFPEPVQVLVVVPMGSSVKLISTGINTNHTYQSILNAEQLEQLEYTPEKEPFNGNPQHFRFGVESLRLSLAYEYDPYFALAIAINQQQQFWKI